MQVNQYTQPLARQKLFNQLYNLDFEAREACISFLEERYPAISREQAEKLVDLLFENNFKAHLPNHFGKFAFEKRRFYGFPFIWLLNELSTDGIRYLYKNGIWQIHWDVGSRYDGEIRHDERETIKYLVTCGPGGVEGQRLWEEHSLIFYSYWHPTSSEWQYPVPEDADLSGFTEFLMSLKMADHCQLKPK